MNAALQQADSPGPRLGTFVLAALTLVTAVGCWQEVHYDPSREPSPPPSVSAVVRDETPSEQLRSTSAEGPSATQLFADDEIETPPGDEATATQVTPSPEKQPKDDPLWDGLETEEVVATSVEPAPPAEIDWPKQQQQQPVAAPAAPDYRTALAAWRMASKWSLAVGIFGKGWPAERYEDVWQQADYAAQILDVQLPPLPKDVAAEDVLAQATTMLLEEAGPLLADSVGTEHGIAQRALCDLAIKTHALLLFYTPTDSELEPFIAEIRQAGEDSPLPERLWQPLLDSLNAGNDFQEVKQAVFELHDQATDYLGERASQ